MLSFLLTSTVFWRMFFLPVVGYFEKNTSFFYSRTYRKFKVFYIYVFGING
jgi:hypothetical protein